MWILLDITHPGADLSHWEMILHCLVGLLLAPVNAVDEDEGNGVFNPILHVFGVAENHCDMMQWETTAWMSRTAGLEEL